MISPEELFDKIFVFDDSLSDAAQATIRASFPEIYNNSVTVREKFENLQTRLNASSVPHDKITIKLAKAGDGTELKPFDIEGYLKGQSSMSLQVNFDQLKRTNGCDLNTGKVGKMGSLGLVLWAHEIAGHATDGRLHILQDTLLQDPRITSLTNTPDSIKVGERIYSKTMSELYDAQNKEIPFEHGSLWEIHAVGITDIIRQELNAENSANPFVLREVFSNGAHKTFNDFMNDTNGLSDSRIREILEKGVKNRDMDFSSAATNKDLYEMWKQGDCTDQKEMKLERKPPAGNLP